MIIIDSLWKKYQTSNTEFIALKGVSLEIEKGEFVAITGRSGCGKTTLLNCVGLMDKPSEGRYFLNGTDTSKLTAKETALLRNQNIGFIFQAFHLIKDYSALENIEMPMGYAGIGAKKRRERAEELLERVGLADKHKNLPSQLSGGQQQRIAIARALVNSPALLLADEPTGNLDSETGEDVMELLRSLNDDGMTIVMVTHDEMVASYATRRVYMKDGIIIEL